MLSDCSLSVLCAPEPAVQCTTLRFWNKHTPVFPIKKYFFYVQEAVAEVSFTAVVFRQIKKVVSEEREDVSCSYGVWPPWFSYASPEHSVRNLSSKMSMLCPLQNQVVVAAGRSSWGARLSGALHVYSLSSD